MSSTPDLPGRVEGALLSVFKDAFPGVTIGSASSPTKRGERSVGVKADQQGEDPQGTNIHDVEITVEARNLEFQERELMRQMLGTSTCALATLRERSQNQLSFPSGQPVEVSGPVQSAEDEDERILTYTLSASIQPT